MTREYPTQCWSCLGEFDAVSAIWCACSAKSATKLCPFCFRCFCQADTEYRETFWRNAPVELKEERDILKEAAGSSGEALIRSNMLSTDQLLSALRWQQNRGVTLENALVDLGFVSRENLDLVMKRQAPGAAVDLTKGLIDAHLVKKVTIELCFRKRILPLAKEEIGEMTVLTLAMAGPTDVETIDQVQSLTDCRVIPMNAPEQEILDKLQDLFPKEIAALRASPSPPPISKAGAQAARQVVRVADRRPAPSPAQDAPEPADREAPGPALRRPAKPPRTGRQAAVPKPVDDPLEIEEEAEAPAAPRPEPSPAPVPASMDHGAALQAILAEAIAKKTSLVQCEIRDLTLSLYFRIDGNLHRVKPSSQMTAEGLRGSLDALGGLPAGDRPAAGRLTVRSGERRIDVVVRRLHSPAGTSFILKIIERADFLRPLADLGPSAHDIERLVRALAQPKGLIVLSAPPHNGLETTRYSLMAHLGIGGRRVLALDSPQLLSVPGTRQEEIPFQSGAERCRTVLAGQHGGEVVFLPEIQDSAMAALALETASTALVVAALQARRASQTPGALLWHQVDPKTLAASLILVVNQRLVRRICHGCRRTTPVTDRVLKMMGLTSDEALDLKASQGGGCDRCGAMSPGYDGRIALFEVLEGTPEIAALIGGSASHGEIEREARRAGMSPLRAGCLSQVGQGVTTLEEFQKGNF